MNGIAAIALDGPVASGKTAVGRLLARKLGYRFLDTGIMYRAVTWAAVEAGVSPKDASALVTLARNRNMEVAFHAETDASVLIEGQDVSAHLRQPRVEEAVSPVSSVAGVREVLVTQQRRIAKDGPVVMAGRDIGTVVLPDAPVKVFLTASVDERARRRHAELQAQEQGVTYEEVLREIQQRDRIDSERAVSPLRPASDAQVLVTDGMTVGQVVDFIMALVRRT